ncbi:MAG: PD-(D/E)XK nuclease family protein [Ilumatobacteraceae bacterium]
MITELIDDTTHIWFRQSWLDTAFRCPERGRLAMTKPEWDETSSDSALIGTAVHSAIETHLNEQIDITDLDVAASDWLADYSGPIKWTKYTQLSELQREARVCAAGWVNDIRPHLPNLDGAQTEVTFKIPLWSQHGYTVGITGTIDLIADGQLWDWKTSAREYKPSEKQKHAIQPTIYTLAAIKGGLVPESSFPMPFHYGVMLRGSKPKGQILQVTRDMGHADWAVKRMMGFVDLLHFFGQDNPWPANDEHFLCSSTWCPWYSICRGAHMTIADDRISE